MVKNNITQYYALENMIKHTYSKEDLMKQLAQKRIIGVASEIAGGTTTFAKYAAEQCGASTHTFSTPLRDIVAILNSKTVAQPLEHAAKRLYLVNTKKTSDMLLGCFQNEFGECFADSMSEGRDVLQRLSTALRQTVGENCIAQAIFGDVYKDTNNHITVEGIRRLADISILGTLPNFTFVYIDATLEVRYPRFLHRDQYADEKDITFEEFRKMCSHESEQQICGLKKHADVVIDTNPLPGESNVECLARYHREIKKIITK